MRKLLFIPMMFTILFAMQNENVPQINLKEKMNQEGPAIVFEIIKTIPKEKQMDFLNQKDENGRTVLMHSILESNADAVDILIHLVEHILKENVLDLFNVQDDEGKTALMMFCKKPTRTDRDTYERLERLYRKFKFIMGKLAESSPENIIKYLNIKNNEGNTFLMIACNLSMSGHVEEIIEIFAPILQENIMQILNAQNDEGKTALMMAHKEGREIDIFLIKFVAETHPESLLDFLNAADEIGDTALLKRAQDQSGNCAQGHEFCLVKRLLNTIRATHPEILFPYLNVKNIYENTPLMIAVLDKNETLVKEMLNEFQEFPQKDLLDFLNAKNKQGNNALMMATKKRDFKIMKNLLKVFDENLRPELLKHLNQKNKKGQTVLMIASDENEDYRISMEILRSLIQLFGKQDLRQPIIGYHIKTVPIDDPKPNALLSSIILICMVNSKSNENLPILGNKYLLAKIILYLVGPRCQDLNLIDGLFPDYNLKMLKE